jgi:hypothetical protein
MGLKSRILKPIASRIARSIQHRSHSACEDQHKILLHILSRARMTAFGIDHEFTAIRSHEDFRKAVPVRNYERLKDYFDRIAGGEPDVTWPGKPRYLAKTSGTTSGVKYIPITRDSIPNHFRSARNAVFSYSYHRRRWDHFDRKMIFLSGSPKLDKKNGIYVGRLSGIVNHLVPRWAKLNQVPSYQTNCIEDWEEKLEHIVRETLRQDMGLISGIPPWVQMYYERLLEVTGKSTIKEIFPNYNLFVYGGVNYEPYRSQLIELVGEDIDSIETYPASEGFIAYQDKPGTEGLLLNTNSGIFYEFIPLEEIEADSPARHALEEVETKKQYVIILSSNAGIWGYSLGDTVEFVSLDPYRIRVTGRVTHFISAFGEHVIGKEVEEAIIEVSRQMEVQITEFTVAPQVNPPEGGLPHHQWLVEFEQIPEKMDDFANALDLAMRRQNIYYDDLISGKILRPLEIITLKPNAFRDYMKGLGKLGGQNKVPRLSNTRDLADKLLPYVMNAEYLKTDM